MSFQTPSYTICAMMPFVSYKRWAINHRNVVCFPLNELDFEVVGHLATETNQSINQEHNLPALCL